MWQQIQILTFLAFTLYFIGSVKGQCSVCQNDYCKNNGTCKVSENCSFSCMCDDNFSGNHCEYEVKNKINDQTSTIALPSTLRPISSRTCLFGMLTCVHGFCLNGMKCSCDQNWKGAMCEKLDCPVPCIDQCELAGNTLSCIESTHLPATVTPAMLKQETTTDSSLTTSSSLRSIAERSCLGGAKICMHGYCDASTFSCICDKNWRGTLCQDLDCGSENCSTGCELTGGEINCLFSSELITDTSTVRTTKPATTASVGWSLEQRTCTGFFVCDHGYCKKESIRFYCVCDEFWSGMFCSVPDCPKQCPGDCTFINGQTECNNRTQTTTAEVNIIDEIDDDPVTTTTIGPINGTFPDGHACSANYSYEESYCFGIPCKYGTCKLHNDTSGVNKMQCSCDPGATGPMCESKCCRICQNGGLCKRNSTGDEFCNCHYNYEGEYCENKKKGPEEEIWYWYVVGACLGLMVILILALVVLPYWMWRNRVILIMKIVHYFQRYEDNDEREWDAFISYKCDEKDEAFVLKQLYSKLEVEMGFKLCLHFRDFIPGDTISNNIIRAVQGSRRTIILLTPRYVQSEFTKFEYQMAQTEMLKRRHRIIPLVLEDISPLKEELDPNLEQIIHSVTYLEWPKEEDSLKIQKFWKKLVLSMPKKKDVEERRKAMSSSSSPSSYNFCSQISEIPLVNNSSSSVSLDGVSVMPSETEKSSDTYKEKNSSCLPSQTFKEQSNGYVPSQTNKDNYLPSEQFKSNKDYKCSEPINTGDIVLKISDDLYDMNKNEESSSKYKSNIDTYLELIDPDSATC